MCPTHPLPHSQPLQSIDAANIIIFTDKKHFSFIFLFYSAKKLIFAAELHNSITNLQINCSKNEHDDK